MSLLPQKPLLPPKENQKKTSFFFFIFYSVFCILHSPVCESRRFFCKPNLFCWVLKFFWAWFVLLPGYIPPEQVLLTYLFFFFFFFFFFFLAYTGLKNPPKLPPLLS